MNEEIQFSSFIKESFNILKISFDELLELFNNTAKHKKFYKFLKISYILAFILQVALVFLMGVLYSPIILFDDINTLRIAEQGYTEIIKILSYEQNFPLYYFFYHVILEFTDKAIYVMRTINFSLWLLLIAIFYKILKKYTTSKPDLYLGVYLFTLLSSIYFYSFITRMYMLFLMIFSMLFYVILKYIENNKVSYIVIIISLLSLLSFIHPLNGPLIIILGVLFIFLAKNKKQYFTFLVLLIIPVIIFASNLLIKSRDIVSLYITDGVSYLGELPDLFFNFPEKLFFGIKTQLSIAVFIFSVFFFLKFLKGHNQLIKKNYILLYFSFIFIVLMLILNSFSNYRHYIYLVIPVFLSLLLGIFTMRKKKLIKYFIIVSMFMLMNLISIATFISTSNFSAKYCEDLKKIEPDGLIITQFNQVHTLKKCLVKGRNDILVIGGKGVFPINLEDKNYLEKLAIWGGMSHELANGNIKNGSAVGVDYQLILKNFYKNYNDFYHIVKISNREETTMFINDVNFINNLSSNKEYKIYHYKNLKE